MAKFKVGDKVKVFSGKDIILNGTIQTVYEKPDHVSEKYQEYGVIIEETGGRFVYDQDHLDYPDPPAPPENESLKVFKSLLAECESDEYSEGNQSDVTDDEIFLEMATVKWGFDSIKLAIYGSEGNGYPHFHFYKGLKPDGGIPESYRSGGGCLTIESPNYFVHEGHTEKLSPKEIKGLIKFLHEKNRTIKSITNWEYIVALWNDNNPDKKQLPLDIDIPDYRSDMGTIQETIEK